MKVLHIEAGRHLYGGARQVQYLLDGLQQAGVENHLICPPDAEIGDAAVTSAKVWRVAMKGDLDLGQFWRLRRIMRQIEPDLVHIHSRRGADLFGGLAARWAGVPVILSRRVDNPEPRWLVARKYRLFDRVVCISRGIEQVLRDEGVPASKLRHVSSAIKVADYQQPCGRAEFLTEFGLPDNAIVGAVIAQLIRRKGHRYLIQALPEVLKAQPNLHLLWFGQGPLRDELEQQVNAAGLAGHIHFTGFREDLPRWLACLDLLVHPADMEGLGVSLLQAGAAGVPMIGSRAGGIPEIVLDGQTGLLIESGDVSALTDALRRLATDAELRKQLGQGAAKHVAEHFDVRAMVAGNLAVYRELLV